VNQAKHMIDKQGIKEGNYYCSICDRWFELNEDCDECGLQLEYYED
jgi:hypothetical protein